MHQTAGRSPTHTRDTRARVTLLRAGRQGRNQVGNLGTRHRKGQGAVRQPTKWKREKVKRGHHVLLGEGKDIVCQSLKPFPLAGKRECGDIGRQWELGGIGENHIGDETKHLQAVWQEFAAFGNAASPIKQWAASTERTIGKRKTRNHANIEQMANDGKPARGFGMNLSGGKGGRPLLGRAEKEGRIKKSLADETRGEAGNGNARTGPLGEGGSAGRSCRKVSG